MVAILLICIALAIAIAHVYWAFGGKGSRKFIPEDDDFKPLFTPSVGSCLAIAACFALLALFAFGKLENYPMHPIINQYGGYVIAIIFFIRAIGDFNYVGFFKKRRHSEFAHHDTFFYSPLCVIIGVLALLV